MGLVLAVTSVLVSAPAYAQSATTPRVDVSVMPGGATIFTEKSGEPSFGTYAAVGTVTYVVSKFVGVEGEFGGNIGISQDIDFTTGTRSAKPAHSFTFGADLIGYVGGRDRRVVPYVTAGAGGLTLLDQTEVSVPNSTTFFTGNAGAGVLASLNDHWGVRVDYRFLAVKSKDDAPAFFGRGDRYGHRITAGLSYKFGK